MVYFDELKINNYKLWWHNIDNSQDISRTFYHLNNLNQCPCYNVVNEDLTELI